MLSTAVFATSVLWTLTTTASGSTPASDQETIGTNISCSFAIKKKHCLLTSEIMCFLINPYVELKLFLSLAGSWWQSSLLCWRPFCCSSTACPFSSSTLLIEKVFVSTALTRPTWPPAMLPYECLALPCLMCCFPSFWLFLECWLSSLLHLLDTWLDFISISVSLMLLLLIQNDSLCGIWKAL